MAAPNGISFIHPGLLSRTPAFSVVWDDKHCLIPTLGITDSIASNTYDSDTSFSDGYSGQPPTILIERTTR
jgi:hypothetical protein